MEHEVVGNDVKVTIGELGIFRHTVGKMNIEVLLNGAMVGIAHHGPAGIDAPHFGIGEPFLVGRGR